MPRLAPVITTRIVPVLLFVVGCLPRFSPPPLALPATILPPIESENETVARRGARRPKDVDDSHCCTSVCGEHQRRAPRDACDREATPDGLGTMTRLRALAVTYAPALLLFVGLII